ncbi:hypothetical protein FRC98_06985 [Lujinxingia vulgaris]|uniref:Lipoprotein n=1 Tax=Lujinxingia vulgaris TaxID=2600176 RepID=A0A5C6XKE9_9DELT|nr:hypothetical protein [Lujinxingia vulgaris]TXD38620.1 hypothetical protein FRC98_06985 [Lujinxingia vulgaris]
MPDRLRTRNGSLCLAVIALALALQACASVQSHPTEALIWRTPMAFDPVEARAPALLEAQGRRGTATLFRLERAYAPTQALVAYRLTLQRDGLAALSDTFTSEPAGPGQWWVFHSRSDETVAHALLTTTPDATWVVRLERTGHDNLTRTRTTLKDLSDGIQPELRPAENALPDLPLGQALRAPSDLYLDPPATSGGPRHAALRELAAPRTLFQGYALAEPLPYPLPADAYLSQLIERYAGQITDLSADEVTSESCGTTCRIATLTGEAWTYTLVAVSSGKEARHLLLWHPSWSRAPNVLQPQQRWVEDFSQRAHELIEVPAL